MHNPEKTNTFKVLFLSAWYPLKYDSMLGLFVKKHARLAAVRNKVMVLHVAPQPEGINDYHISELYQTSFSEVIVYYPKATKSIMAPVINILKWIMAYHKGWKIVKEKWGSPDLIHTNILTRVVIFALLAKWRWGIPYIITEHWSRYLPGRPAFRNPIHYFATRFLIRASEQLTVVSSLLGEAMRKRKLCNSYAVLPNLVDTELFTPLTQSSRDSHIKRIAHISCFEDASKNICGTIEAIKVLSETRQDFSFHMIGTGVDLPAAKQMASQYHLLDKKIYFEGLLEDHKLADFLSDCDFLILFSHYETFGIVVYESLACGVPVAVTDVADFRRNISPELGRVANDPTPESLARVIEYMLNNHKSFNREYLRDFVVENFSAEPVSLLLQNIYTEALSKHNPDLPSNQTQRDV